MYLAPSTSIWPTICDSMIAPKSLSGSGPTPRMTGSVTALIHVNYASHGKGIGGGILRYTPYSSLAIRGGAKRRGRMN